MSRKLKISGLAAVSIFVSLVWSWKRMEWGYGVDSSRGHETLNRIFGSELEYSNFASGSVEKIWMNGFREHTYLFKISMGDVSTEELMKNKALVEGGPWNSSNRGHYLGPSRAPKWWDSETLDYLPSKYFYGERERGQ